MAMNVKRHCLCGCGEVTSSSRRYWKVGHHLRLSGALWTVEDRGYKTPCWIWQHSINGCGYADRRFNGVPRAVHLIHYEEKYGRVPKGKQLDHLCRIRHCVNPDHVEPVTKLINAMRGKVVKLTPSQVKQIRRRFAQGGITKVSLAIYYGVSDVQIGHIVRGEQWSASVMRAANK